jgi:carboxyl-terminal processing protease
MIDQMERSCNGHDGASGHPFNHARAFIAFPLACVTMRSMVARRILFGIAAFALVALAFFAGYATYPLVHEGSLGLSAGSVPDGVPGSPDMGVYWQVWDLLDRDFFGEKPASEQRTYGAIAGMVQSFGDPYTYFVEPQSRELERDELAGKFGGIGANVEQTEWGYVVHPLTGQPAAQAGVQDGDLLLMVDDQEITTSMSSDEVIAFLRGAVGSTVTLVVRRHGNSQPNATEMTFTATRAEIQTPSIEWRLLDDSPQTADIGYMRQTIFSERSPQEMRQAIEELRKAGANRYVWDLRGNPGGLVNSAVEQADMWLDSGTIVVEEKAGGLRKTFEATPGTLVANGPLVLVVDGRSASASEIVAGALRDHHRAQIVGEKTYGKGSVQLIHELSDQSSLHVTNAQWFTPNGQQISGKGLMPDVMVATGVDPLSTAVNALLAVQEAKTRESLP